METCRQPEDVPDVAETVAVTASEEPEYRWSDDPLPEPDDDLRVT